MMARVFFQILGQIGPAAADAHHDALACFADESDVEFYGDGGTGLVQVVEFYFWFAWGGLEGRAC